MLKLEVYNNTIQQSYLHDRLSRLISQELAEKAGLSVQSSSTNVGLRYSRWSGFRIPDHRLSLLSLLVPWSLPPVFSISMMHQFLATPLKFINATSTVRTSSLWFPESTASSLWSILFDDGSGCLGIAGLKGDGMTIDIMILSKKCLQGPSAGWKLAN